jgi:dynein heavy chain
MTVVRHGMMLVGPTGGGKSQVFRALQAAMSRVKDDPEFRLVRVYQMNPKSITMNQLYGAFDLQTGEWTDGIGAVLIRHISQPNTEETGVQQDEIKWMNFDGPVDAIWIENMNTVLDDNKKLCLNSGEIIPLAENNRIMFEVEDLSVASPATISRNGMIYIEPPYLLPEKTAPEKASETPLLKTWLEQLPQVSSSRPQP